MIKNQELCTATAVVLTKQESENTWIILRISYILKTNDLSWLILAVLLFCVNTIYRSFDKE